jgi:hypothetical protein
MHREVGKSTATLALDVRVAKMRSESTHDNVHPSGIENLDLLLCVGSQIRERTTTLSLYMRVPWILAKRLHHGFAVGFAHQWRSRARMYSDIDAG